MRKLIPAELFSTGKGDLRTSPIHTVTTWKWGAISIWKLTLSANELRQNGLFPYKVSVLIYAIIYATGNSQLPLLPITEKNRNILRNYNFEPEIIIRHSSQKNLVTRRLKIWTNLTDPFLKYFQSISVVDLMRKFSF